MAYPNVTGIFPPFDKPDWFERLRNGQYTCKICSPGTPPTFQTEKAALAHERTKRHVENAELEARNDWGVPFRAQSADWRSDPDEKDKMTPDEIKDIEYRRKVSELPVTVAKWREGWMGYVRNGEMLPVDEPGPSSRRKSHGRRGPKATNAPAAKVESSEDETLVKRSSGSVGNSSDDARGGPATSRLNTLARTPVGQVPLRPQPRPFFVQRPVQPIPPSDPRRIELTPALRSWLEKINIEYRFSPTKARHMQEFVQLPTDTKVDMIQNSVGQLRAMLFI